MLLFALLMAMQIFAVPAKPGLTRQLTLADGTKVEARLVGDEYGHYWLGTDGKAYQENSTTGVFEPVNATAITNQAQMRRNAVNARRAKRMAPRKVGEVGSYIGKKKGLILLVNFSDVSFKSGNNQALYERIANEKNFSEGKFKGSMNDYFFDQSNGQFDLEFDVVGPLQVSKAQSYYGSNNRQGEDKYAATMVIEALALADDEVNYADYDWDGDGEVDQVYVVYAGKGEADGGGSNTIWPHEWTLSDALSNNDGSGPQMIDGVKIDTYACGSELEGSKGTIAGIGTMCHEFSHCLGYPDFYDTDYSGGWGMGYWDLMDGGSYNGDGFQPAGYTSYERWVAGWSEPVVLEKSQAVTGMKALQKGGESYIIYNKGNTNEFFLLENRQKTGWDTSLPGEGLLIIHVDYDAQIWNENTPNDNPNRQRMTWIAADNEYQYTVYQGTKYYTFEGMANDTYPYGSVKAFGRSTTPAAKFYNKNADGSYYLDSSVESIAQNSDGTISFKFKGASTVATPTFTPAAGKYAEAQNVTISCVTAGAVIHYTTDGSTPTASSPTYSGPIAVEATTTIKAIAITEEEESAVASATYIIGDIAPSGKTFKRVTSTSELKSGANFIIGCGSKSRAAGALSGTYLSSVDVTLANDIITINDDVQVLTLVQSGTGFAFVNEEGKYLYATDAKKLTYGDEMNTWTLSDDDSGVTMTCGEYGTILYNVNNPRFTTYTSKPNTSMILANIYMESDDVAMQDPTISFSTTSVTFTMGGTFTEPTLTVSPSGLEVKYSSSDTRVATVDANTGKVTILGEGTTVITATTTATSTYNSGTASYTLTVKKATEPVPGGSGDYVLVTSDDQLKVSDLVIIVGEKDGTYYAMSTNQRDNNRAAVTVTMNDDGTIAGNDDVQDIMLEKNNDLWIFNVGDGYLYAASSTKNILKTAEEVDADGNSDASISIADDVATIMFNGSNTRNSIRFNYNSGTPIFSCYAPTSTMSDVWLYRKRMGIKGDVNGDGTVNITDVMLAVNDIISEEHPASFIFDNADMNEDGTITITDVMNIVNIIIGNN